MGFWTEVPVGSEGPIPLGVALLLCPGTHRYPLKGHLCYEHGKLPHGTPMGGGGVGKVENEALFKGTCKSCAQA